MFNDNYCRDASIKIRSHLDVRRRNGKFIGSFAAYGYFKDPEDKNHLLIDDEAAAVVRDIFAWKISGMSNQGIADKLNHLGILSPMEYKQANGIKYGCGYKVHSKALWSSVAVRRILTSVVYLGVMEQAKRTNLTYLGHMVQGRRRSQFYAGIPDRRLPQSEWIIVENTHEPLVDRETFDRVQALRQADKEKYHANLGKYDHLGTEENIFRGLVFCGDCGRPMVRYKEVSHEKKVFYRFICPNYADLVERSGCAYKYLPVDDLKTVLSRLIAQEVALAADVAALLSKRRSSTVSAASLELARASSERASLDVLRERLMRDLLAGVLSKEDHDRMKRKYAQEGQELDKRIAQLQKAQRREKELLTTRNPWLTVFRQHTGEIQLTDKLVHTLVERITVYKNNRVEICLKYQDERAALLDALEQHGKEVSA